jgi:hypothetical protein
MLAYKRDSKTGKVTLELEIITLSFIIKKEKLGLFFLRNPLHCQFRAVKNKNMFVNYLKELKGKTFNYIRSKITGFTESYLSDMGE